MLLMERIPGQTGYLILTADGAVLESGGDLQNDEHSANLIMSIITIANRIEKGDKGGPYHKLSISYEDHSYVVCLSNKKIHIVKKQRLSNSSNAPSPPEPSLNINV